VREGNVGEEWHGIGSNGNSNNEAKKNTPKKREGNETVLRPMQKQNKVRETYNAEE